MIGPRYILLQIVVSVTANLDVSFHCTRPEFNRLTNNCALTVALLELISKVGLPRELW